LNRVDSSPRDVVVQIALDVKDTVFHGGLPKNEANPLDSGAMSFVEFSSK
jgi:hypothetical protein